MHTNVYNSIIYNHQDMKANLSVPQQTKKRWYVYMMDYYPAMKRTKFCHL